MRVTKQLLDAKRAKLLEQLREVDQQIEDLTPPEPASGCIRFEKSYRGNIEHYRFAAVRGTDRRWYVTGRVIPGGGLAWENLLEFIRKDNVLPPSFQEVVSSSRTELL